MQNKKYIAGLIILISLITGNSLHAQSITTGDITGIAKDSSNAIVPGATVTLKRTDTGETRSAITNGSGSYRFNLLKPGTYQIAGSIQGLQSDISSITVAVGQARSFDLTLSPQQAQQTVNVTEATPLLQTDSSNQSTTFSTAQLQNLPNPGGDITTVAFTVPGVAVATQSGYGSFSSHGLPATANLFTINGNDAMDPYFNVNNSGASNLSLGQNEIAEAAVVQNGYSVQYGRQAGAQVNYVTKSGANDYHANLQYNWNGSLLNANDFFNNASGTPKGRANSNQYAASLGGRIIKDKLFFFVDTEGIRYVLPSSGGVALPSSQLQSYVLSQVTPSQSALYQKAFGLYNNAPGASRASDVTNGSGQLQDGNNSLGCGNSFAGTPAPGGGIFGETVPCARAFGTNVTNQNTQWLLTSRVDYNISDKQRIFFRFRDDQGTQPTYTDPINPAFNAQSKQPSYEGNINHTYAFSSTLINNFIATASAAQAAFAPADLQASLAVFPTSWRFFDGGINGSNIGGTGPGGMSNLGVPLASYPQGRNTGQFQFIDDLSWNKGSHNIKVGATFRRNRVTDLGLQTATQGGYYTFNDLTDFTGGVIDGNSTGSSFIQRFSPLSAAHIHLYTLGGYIQDEWAVKSNFKITYGIRFDRTGNPVCTDDCFARLNAPFADLAKGASIPYNQSITTGLNNAFQNIESVVPQPRLGMVWNPSASKGTVIRGGIGLFTDLPAASYLSNIFRNSPNVFAPTIRTGNVDLPGITGSAPTIASLTNTAFRSGFANGSTSQQIASSLPAGVTFTNPAYFSVPNTLNNPRYVEWSFELQQQVGTRNLINVTYVGNYGYNLLYQTAKANAYANASRYPNGFGGLPATAPDPRFNIVTDLSNRGESNYNGVTVQFRRALGFGFQGQISYTWSHALDDISNGGINAFNLSDSFLTQFAPFDKSLNYSNADYDIRHNVTADFTWEIPVKVDNGLLKQVVQGWTVAGKAYARTGTPFSVYNSTLASRLSAAVGGQILGTLVNPAAPTSCTGPNSSCFSGADFTSTGFGNLPRNSFRGPGFFDMDATLLKNFAIGEKYHFQLGANAYNILNHPNFGTPGSDLALSGVGSITTTTQQPTSAYGTFQGSAVSGRVVVLSGRFQF